MILDALKRQFRSVIEWENPLDDQLFHQWSSNGDEIKNTSKLIVGPGQGCIFVYRGKIRAVHMNEGIYELKTANIPFITTLVKFMQFFESEHKVSIYFFKTTDILNQKWGTTNPIKYLDSHYQFPVALKAYGNFSFRISEPRKFFTNFVGETDSYLVSDFKEVMVQRLVQPITDFFATSRHSFIHIDAERNEIASELLQNLGQEFSPLGFYLTDFRIEGTQFDSETLARINRIADTTSETLAAKAAGIDYTELQKLEALKDAAKNEGGTAGAGVGIGAGIALGQQMTGDMMAGHATQTNTSPSLSSDEIMGILETLKKAYDADILSEQEFTKKKLELLDRL